MLYVFYVNYGFFRNIFVAFLLEIAQWLDFVSKGISFIQDEKYINKNYFY